MATRIKIITILEQYSILCSADKLITNEETIITNYPRKVITMEQPLVGSIPVLVCSAGIMFTGVGVRYEVNLFINYSFHGLQGSLVTSLAHGLSSSGLFCSVGFI